MKCKQCGREIERVITHKGEMTEVNAEKVRVCTLLELSGGELKIEDVVEGHVAHETTCWINKELANFNEMVRANDR